MAWEGEHFHHEGHEEARGGGNISPMVSFVLFVVKRSLACYAVPCAVGTSSDKRIREIRNGGLFSGMRVFSGVHNDDRRINHVSDSLSAECGVRETL